MWVTISSYRQCQIYLTVGVATQNDFERDQHIIDRSERKILAYKV